MHETEPRLPLIAQLPEPHYSTFSQFPGLSVKMSTVILVSAPPPPHNQKKETKVMLDIQIKPLLLDIINKYLE